MNYLAINGGSPVRRQPFSPWPFHTTEEESALLNTVRSGQWWRKSGTAVNEFEKNFAINEKSSYALAVTNGTHAIELALMTLSVACGDEVIVPAITFISTATAVYKVGATPVIVDVFEDTFNINPTAVEKHITAKTKAIIAVHMGGQVADMAALSNLSKKYNIPIIQDAAHAQGAQWREKGLGELETIATYSFQNAKLMTCGEGGALTFPSEKLYKKAFKIHNCGREITDTSYIHTEVGSNYRMGEFSAAILSVQLKRLRMQSELRQANFEYLSESLDKNSITIQKNIQECTFNPIYMFMFRLSSSISRKRDFFVQALNAEGIPAFRSYKPIYQIDAVYNNQNPILSKSDWAARCPASELIGDSAIWLPHNLLLGDSKDMNDIIDGVHKVIEGCHD